MRNKLSVRVSSVALAVAVSAAFVPNSASALTLMDILRGRQKESQRPPVVEQPQQQQKQVKRTYSTPKVAPPKYYTYRADGVRMISIDEIRDPVVTGSIEPEDGVEDANMEVASLDQTSASDAVETETTVAIGANDPRQYLTDARVKAIDDVASAVESYYSNGGELIWVEDGDVSSGRAMP